MVSKELYDNSAWSAGEPNARPEGWQAARRHSRWVRALRIGLPLVTVVIVAGIVLSLRALPGSVGEIRLGDFGISGSSLTMDSPRLTGYGARGMAYDVQAERAVQDVASPNVVHLELIDGRVEPPEGGWTRVMAAKGVYNGEVETLRLDEDIEVYTHDGKRAFLHEADVDLETQSVVSERPVRLQMPGARITADRMEATEGGARVLLRGRVKVDLRLDGGPLEEDGYGR